MCPGPVGPVKVFFYWPEDVFGYFYWPGAIGLLLASSPEEGFKVELVLGAHGLFNHSWIFLSLNTYGS